MKNKLFIIALALLSTFYANAQTKFTKENICKNWMVVSFKPPTATQSYPRESRKTPEADFIINSDGSYNLKFDGQSSGTWRQEGDVILFWEKKEGGEAKIIFATKIKECTENKMIMTFLYVTKYYDGEIELVPFN